MSFILKLKNLAASQGEEYKNFNSQLDTLLSIINKEKDEKETKTSDNKQETKKNSSYLQTWQKALDFYGYKSVKKTDTDKYILVRAKYDELRNQK